MAKGRAVGDVFIRIGGDDAPLNKALQRVSARLTSVGRQVATIGRNFAASGAAITGPLLLAARVYSQLGDQLDKISARTGVAASSLAELGNAAERGGANIEAIEKGIRRLQVTVYDAEQGLATATDGLAALGVSAQELRALSPEDQFLAIAQRLADVEDVTLRAALATRVLGRAGVQLLPVFAGGAGALAELRSEARRLGALTTAEATRAAVLTDAFFDLAFAGKNLVAVIGAAIAPELTAVAKLLASAAGAAVNFIRDNRALVVSVAAVGAALAAVGVTLVVVGGGIAIVGFAAAGLAAGLAAVAAAAAVVVSPVGLVVAGITAAVVAFATMTDAGRRLVAFLRDRFGALLSDFGAVIKTMVAGLQSGNIAEAAASAMSRVRAVFLEARACIR